MGNIDEIKRRKVLHKERNFKVLICKIKCLNNFNYQVRKQCFFVFVFIRKKNFAKIQNMFDI